MGRGEVGREGELQQDDGDGETAEVEDLEMVEMLAYIRVVCVCVCVCTCVRACVCVCMHARTYVQNCHMHMDV